MPQYRWRPWFIGVICGRTMAQFNEFFRCNEAFINCHSFFLDFEIVSFVIVVVVVDFFFVFVLQFLVSFLFYTTIITISFLFCFGVDLSSAPIKSFRIHVAFSF